MLTAKSLRTWFSSFPSTFGPVFLVDIHFLIHDELDSSLSSIYHWLEPRIRSNTVGLKLCPGAYIADVTTYTCTPTCSGMSALAMIPYSLIFNALTFLMKC